jgi:hypothetical protein
VAKRRREEELSSLVWNEDIADTIAETEEVKSNLAHDGDKEEDGHDGDNQLDAHDGHHHDPHHSLRSRVSSAGHAIGAKLYKFSGTGAVAKVYRDIIEWTKYLDSTCSDLHKLLSLIERLLYVSTWSDPVLTSCLLLVLAVFCTPISILLYVHPSLVEESIFVGCSVVLCLPLALRWLLNRTTLHIIMDQTELLDAKWSHRQHKDSKGVADEPSQCTLRAKAWCSTPAFGVGIPQWSKAYATARRIEHRVGGAVLPFRWFRSADEEEEKESKLQPHFEFSHDWQRARDNITSDQILHIKLLRMRDHSCTGEDGEATVGGYVTVPLQRVYDKYEQQKQKMVQRGALGEGLPSRLPSPIQAAAEGGAAEGGEQGEALEEVSLGTVVETYNITDVRDPHLKYQHYSMHQHSDVHHHHHHSSDPDEKSQHKSMVSKHHHNNRHAVGTIRLRISVLGDLANATIGRHVLTVTIHKAERLPNLAMSLLKKHGEWASSATIDPDVYNY